MGEFYGESHERQRENIEEFKDEDIGGIPLKTVSIGSNEFYVYRHNKDYRGKYEYEFFQRGPIRKKYRKGASSFIFAENKKKAVKKAREHNIDEIHPEEGMVIDEPKAKDAMFHK